MTTFKTSLYLRNSLGIVGDPPGNAKKSGGQTVKLGARPPVPDLVSSASIADIKAFLANMQPQFETLGRLKVSWCLPYVALQCLTCLVIWGFPSMEVPPNG